MYIVHQSHTKDNPMTTPNAVVTSPAVKTEPTYEELKARLAILERKAKFHGSMLKVTAKGAVSLYGQSARFPLTRTKKQWNKIIAIVKSGELEKFLVDNDAELFQGQEASE